jgi:hypothetical protein
MKLILKGLVSLFIAVVVLTNIASAQSGVSQTQCYDSGNYRSCTTTTQYSLFEYGSWGGTGTYINLGPISFEIFKRSVTTTSYYTYTQTSYYLSNGSWIMSYTQTWSSSPSISTSTEYKAGNL